MLMLARQTADALAASTTMHSFVDPIITTLCIVASLVCTFFLVMGGIQYMSSSGKPESLEHAKATLKNALIGLILVIAAATLTAILSHAYGAPSATGSAKLPHTARRHRQFLEYHSQIHSERSTEYHRKPWPALRPSFGFLHKRHTIDG